MDLLFPLLLFGLGLMLGTGFGFLAGSWKAQGRTRELQALLDSERKSMAEKAALLQDAQSRLTDVFKSLSSDVLKSNSDSFLQLAQTHLTQWQSRATADLEKRQEHITQSMLPIKDSLIQFNEHLHKVEKDRQGTFSSLAEQLRALLDSERDLRQEAGRLVAALKTPLVRGQWGEIQLRRVIELAGMLAHCDFTEQVSTTDVEGNRWRPDVIVRLPGGKNIIIDAKAPLNAFLESLQADDATRRIKLQDHVRLIRTHMDSLSRKAYWDQFDQVPEFVVLFLPGEHFFSAALEIDPSLIEQGVQEKVILATPTTLIALLKAVAYGWRQGALTANALQISLLGSELYKRLGDLTGHFAEVGEQLDKAVRSYNKAIGSLESRVLVSARKMQDLHATGTQGPIPLPEPISTLSRQIQSPDLLPGPPA